MLPIHRNVLKEAFEFASTLSISPNDLEFAQVMHLDCYRVSLVYVVEGERKLVSEEIHPSLTHDERDLIQVIERLHNRVLAMISPTEVDWRPTETIAEDYYAC